jgi:hypothetical protein
LRIKNVLRYKKPAFWIIVAAIAACVVLAVCFLTNPKANSTVRDSVEKQKLTLEDVILLSAKGNNLKWEDFDKYQYYETGSGLYIRVYVIDEMFSLWIGGGGASTDKSGAEPNHAVNPMYFYLRANDESEGRIDIRTRDVEAFINEHKGNTVVKDIAHDFFRCQVGYSEEAFFKMFETAENRDTIILSSAQHLPVIKIDSTAELDSFYKKMGDYFEFAQSYDEAPAFSEVAEKYDEEFFKTNTLFLIYITEPSTSNRHDVEYVRKQGDKLTIGIMRSEPEAGYTAMAGWLIAVEVSNEDISSIASVDSYISSTHHPDSGTVNANLIRTYVFKESEDFTKSASVSLFDNGKFSFTFSPISSYIGFGQYEIDKDRLTLNTDDGDFTYVFDMVDDTLVFDAADSSKQTWFSGIYDGAVFR